MIVSPGHARLSKKGWRYSYWVGHFDGTPVMFARRLFEWRGWAVIVNRMVNADMPGCFHSHPAWAVRIVLRGGYVEEMPDGTKRVWRPGMIGIVRPSLAHRIDALTDGVESVSLWLRGPKQHEVSLVGPGWAAARAEWDARVADFEGRP